MISYFDNAYAKTPSKNISIDNYIDYVKTGLTKEYIDKIKDHPEYSKKKQLLPAISIFGEFEQRKSEKIKSYSGFFGVDIDKIDDKVNELFELFKADKFIYLVNRSASGKGLFVVLKTRSHSSKDLFLNAQDYFIKKYCIQIDKSCSDPVRLRFISYDPDIYVNKGADLFTHKVEKDLVKHEREKKYIVVQSNFEAAINEVIESGIDIAPDYDSYLRVAFALVNEFGESGRGYFHAICQNSSKYNFDDAEKKYSNCLKSNNGSITISTLYYYLKLNNIRYYSERTQDVISAATQQKKLRTDQKKTIEKIEDHVGELTDEELEIIASVYESNEDYTKDFINAINPLDVLENFIRSNYEIKRNEITGRYYFNGEQLETEHINTIYIEASKALDKVKVSDVESLIFSLNTHSFNPVFDFINEHEKVNPTGYIDQMASCIGAKNQEETEYNKYFFKKWFVGMVAMQLAGYEVSPLILVLVGKQGSGKTTFLRNLLPIPLKSLYSESKLDQGKDDELLMCEKAIVNDDEFSGKSKQDERKLKELSSKDTFSLRRPYGKTNIDVKRRAALCGACNDNEILSDPTGNRRIIPINADEININAFLQIDKTYAFIEAVRILKDGYDYRVISNDIERLNAGKDAYKVTDPVEELLFKYFGSPKEYTQHDSVDFKTSDILVILQKVTGLKHITSKRIGQVLKANDIDQKIIRVNGITSRVYSLCYFKEKMKQDNPSYEIEDDLPF